MFCYEFKGINPEYALESQLFALESLNRPLMSRILLILTEPYFLYRHFNRRYKSVYIRLICEICGLFRNQGLLQNQLHKNGMQPTIKFKARFFDNPNGFKSKFFMKIYTALILGINYCNHSMKFLLFRQLD
jgi:hypothetical protein